MWKTELGGGCHTTRKRSGGAHSGPWNGRAERIPVHGVRRWTRYASPNLRDSLPGGPDRSPGAGQPDEGELLQEPQMLAERNVVTIKLTHQADPGGLFIVYH